MRIFYPNCIRTLVAKWKLKVAIDLYGENLKLKSLLCNISYFDKSPTEMFQSYVSINHRKFMPIA